jgi:hypothetical protein
MASDRQTRGEPLIVRKSLQHRLLAVLVGIAATGYLVFYGEFTLKAFLMEHGPWTVLAAMTVGAAAYTLFTWNDRIEIGAGKLPYIAALGSHAVRRSTRGAKRGRS